MLMIICPECGGAEKYSTSEQINWPNKSWQRQFFITTICADCHLRKKRSNKSASAKSKDTGDAGAQAAKNDRDVED